jgi:hypothetical protein
LLRERKLGTLASFWRQEIIGKLNSNSEYPGSPLIPAT